MGGSLKEKCTILLHETHYSTLLAPNERGILLSMHLAILTPASRIAAIIGLLTRLGDGDVTVHDTILESYCYELRIFLVRQKK